MNCSTYLSPGSNNSKINVLNPLKISININEIIFKKINCNKKDMAKNI